MDDIHGVKVKVRRTGPFYIAAPAYAGDVSG